MLGALVGRELRVRARGRLLHVLLPANVCLFGGLALGVYGFMVTSGRLPVPAIGQNSLFGSTAVQVATLVAPQPGTPVFFGLSAALLGLTCALVPAVASGCLSGERSAGTLDLLLAHGLSGWQIALGKWLAVVAETGLLVAAPLPTLAVAWLFGGVQPLQAATALLLIAAALAGFAAIGVLCSALTESPLRSALFSYLAVAVCVFGSFLAHTAAVFGGAGPVLRPLLVVNPFVALASAFELLGGQADANLPLGIKGWLTPPSPFGAPLWSFTFALFLLMVPALLVLAALALEPYRRLDLRRQEAS